MRALWLAYPEDARAAACDDVYLWGDCILVAPVLEAGAAHRTTYLPHGIWWDYWSAARVDGGHEVTRGVDLGTLPLYMKAGSILPLGPVKQHTQEASSEPLKLRVYPGADGAFSLYEDDGSSFRYEQGGFTRIACAWDDASRTLSLKADPKGQLPNDRVLNVEIVGQAESKQIKLSADAVTVRF
jgi:alpha-glucosidase/alpha-D-xyloside xylohydrolase